MSENTLCLLRSAAEFSRIQAAKRLNREAGLNFPRPENARVGYTVAVGTKEGFGDAPGDTRSWIGTASSDGKKKKLSLYTDTFTCIQRNIPGEPPGYGTPIDDPIHPFHPSLQRVLPVWRAHPNRTSPKRSFHEPIRCVFGMRSFVSLAFLVSRARAPRMLKTGNKTEEWEYIW